MADIEITHAVTTWSYRLGCGLLLATVLILCSFGDPDSTCSQFLK